MFQLNAHESVEDFAELNKDKPQVVVSTEDLIIDHETILVNINGSLCPIRSLERNGNQWVAGIDFGRDAGYCPRGHDLCFKCRLCHKRGCWYYVEPCWK
jgi:hypothetical protein